MGNEPDGKAVLQRCGEEVSGYIRRQWAQNYLEYNMQIQSYRAAAGSGARQLTS
jgi:hypothetical protein